MKLHKIVAPVKLWKRVLAFLIDSMIIDLIIIFPFKGFFKNIELASIEQSGMQIFLVGLLICVLTLIYWTTLEYSLHQSIGKALFNIYVRSKNKELKLWQCLVRNLTKISLLLLLIDSLSIIFKRDYQRYFEKISVTEVVDGEI